MEEFDFYPPKPELIKKEEPKGWSSTIFSLVLFVMIFLFIFSDKVSFVIMLLSVLLIHELGHYLVMKKFKYKNVRMLFIPLMGAFVNGSKAVYSQRESFLVVASGPIPGVLIGSALLLMSDPLQSTLLFNLGLIFLVLNIINLVPLDPLDGGQLFKLMIRSNHELFLLVFAFLSSIAVIAFGWWINEYFIILFGFLMGFRVRALQKKLQMHKDLNEEDVNFSTTYKKLSNRDYSKIKAIVLEHTPSLAKYMEIAEESEVDAILASQVNNILVTPTRQDASILFKALILFFWIMSFVMPFILFFFIDKQWINHGISNW